MNEEDRELRRSAEKRARESRSRLPDDHPDEIAARAERAAEEKAAGMLRRRDPQHAPARDLRHKLNAKLPDSRSRFE